MKIYKKSRVTNLSKVQGSKGAKRARRISNTLNEFRTKLTQQFAKSIGRVPGFARKQANAVRGSGGDTIVEVVLATAIIATAIGIAYSVANRNLQNGVSAGQRSQALSLASAQIERLKNAYLSNSSDLNKYTIDKPFCILSNGTVEEVNKPDSKCANFNTTQFSLSVSYKNDNRLFSAKSSWRSNTNTAITDELTLYYKLPEASQ